MAALVSSHFDERARAPPFVAAIRLSLLGLVVTAKEAPVMLTARLPAAVPRAFDDFFLRGLYLRGVVDVLALIMVAVS